jgi:small-conductance mechanosensitive channel
MTFLSSIFNIQLWLGYLQSAARALILALLVALLFELGGWWLRGLVLKALRPLFNRGAGREAAGRARRGRQLRDWTRGALRWVQNVGALLVIFCLWHLEPLAVAVIVATLVYAGRGLVGDAVAAWSLLADDCLAPGDRVQINGGPGGTVAECGVRRVKLVDESGRAWWIRCSEIVSVLNATAQGAEAGTKDER